MSSRLFPTRQDCLKRDGCDLLAPIRRQFAFPDGVIYLDGNSLGPRPIATRQRVADVVERDWGDALITSWNAADWIGLPVRVGAKIGMLLGTRPGEVVVADSTSVNLFKALAAALALRPDRRLPGPRNPTQPKAPCVQIRSGGGGI